MSRHAEERLAALPQKVSGEFLTRNFEHDNERIAEWFTGIIGAYRQCILTEMVLGDEIESLARAMEEVLNRVKRIDAHNNRRRWWRLFRR